MPSEINDPKYLPIEIKTGTKWETLVQEFSQSH